MRTALVVLCVLLPSCATLNTANMSEACRDAYNACLNSCPSSNPRTPPGGTITTQSLQIDVAGCTNACNDRARSCP